jgi:hypothetical protein
VGLWQDPNYNYTKLLRFALHNSGFPLMGTSDSVASRKDAVLDWKRFKEVKDEHDNLRGWYNVNGLHAEAKLKELELSDIADDLSRRWLTVGH